MGVSSGGIVFKSGNVKAGEEGAGKLKNFIQGNVNPVIQQGFSRHQRFMMEDQNTSLKKYIRFLHAYERIRSYSYLEN